MENEIRAKHPEQTLVLMDANTFGACHTRQTQTACNNSRMAGGTTASRQNALGNQHPMHIVGAGLGSHQHDGYARLAQLFCTVGIKDCFAASGSRRSIEPFGQQSSFFSGLLLFSLSEARQQQLIHLLWLDTLDGFLLANEAFRHHVYSYFDSRLCCALARACL